MSLGFLPVAQDWKSRLTRPITRSGDGNMIALEFSPPCLVSRGRLILRWSLVGF